MVNILNPVAAPTVLAPVTPEAAAHEHVGHVVETLVIAARMRTEPSSATWGARGS